MSRRIILSVIAFASLPLVSGCPLVDIEIDVPEVCISASAIEIAGAADLPDLAGEILLERTIDLTSQMYEMRTSLADLGTTDELRLRSLDVTIAPSPTAPDSLDFVRGLALVFVTPHGTLPPLRAFACDECSTTAGDLDVVVRPLDFLPYLDADVLHLEVALRGDLPREPWSMAIDTCFSSTISRHLEL